jgi:hypothetical protein
MRAAEWLRLGQEAALKEAIELQLPSGAKILARRPDPAQVAMWGRLPLGLSAAAAPGGGPITDEQALEAMHLSRQMLYYCCVQPRISLDPRGDDEIHPRDIPPEDLLFLLRWAMRREEAEQLRPFRGVGTDVGAGGDGQNLRTASVGAAGDRGSGAGAGAGSGGGGDTGAGTERSPGGVRYFS